jgi:hypothetical protein
MSMFEMWITRRHPAPPASRVLIPGSLVVLVGLVGLLTSCAAEPAESSASLNTDFQPTATVEDIMRSMVDPSADALWDAVVVTSTPDGLDERQPETEEDWLSLERGAFILAEAGNLLQIDGRRIAGLGSVSELPGIDLPPDEIAVLVADNRDTWIRLARELHDAGVVMLDAVRARDVAALLEGGDRLDVACENCHTRFWYPNTPGSSAGETGVTPSP